MENSSKRTKEDGVTRELMEGAAKKAVGYADATIPASGATTVLARQHERVSKRGREQCCEWLDLGPSQLEQTWEGQVETQINSQIPKHWWLLRRSGKT